jgi:predicted ester cyclase
MQFPISRRRSLLEGFWTTRVAVAILVAVGLFLVPLLSDSKSQEASSEEQNKELVLRMYTEFDRGELDEFGRSISADFAAHVMGNMSMDWEGFLKFGSQFVTAFPDGRHVFDHVLVDGDYVVTVGSYLGTHEGELMGIAPTHRQIDLAVMHLDRVVDGRIVEHRGIGNAMDLMRQLGVPTGK